MLTLTEQRSHILRFNKRPEAFACAPPEGCCNPPVATASPRVPCRYLKPGLVRFSREFFPGKKDARSLKYCAAARRARSPNRRKQVSLGNTPMHKHARTRTHARKIYSLSYWIPFASQSSPERGVSGVILECQLRGRSSNTFSSSSLCSFFCPGPLMILPR